MKNVSIWTMILLVLLWTTLVFAGSVVAVQAFEAHAVATATATANTPTSIPSQTSIPATSTSTPRPTATPVPPTATPSRMELPVENAGLQIEVLDIEKPYQINLGDNRIFASGAGQMFLGLGIKVTNLTGSDIPFKWNEIYLRNEYQELWYPVWGSYKKTNIALDPLGIEIRQLKVGSKDQPAGRVYFGDNGYLRAIFRVPRDNDYYYLTFADLPLIEIDYGAP